MAESTTGEVGRNTSEKDRIRDQDRAKRRPYLSIQIIIYFSMFAAFVIFVVWLFQIVFLENFYRSARFSDLNKVAHSVTSKLDSESLDSEIEFLALENQVCIIVFDSSGKQVASCDVLESCLIHHTDSDTINSFYAKAKEEGGQNITTIKREGFVSAEGRTLGESVVLTRIVRSASGKEYILVLNAQLIPVVSTLNTMQGLMIWISALVIISGILFALLIIRQVTGPVSKLSRSSRLLAKGDYDADFTVSKGCHEVGELGDALAYAAREISKTDRMQKELIANISHDLRTPLTMIKGYGEVMRDIPGEMTPENMQVIIDETERLSSLVNDLVDISKIQSGAVSLELTGFDLGEVTLETMGRYRKLTEKDGYVINCSCEDKLPVRADKTRILQVIYNLINNAINYTGSDKKIDVKVYRQENEAVFEVTDTGEGIEPDKLDLIWDRYYKVDKVHKRAAVGTGLGLSIVKNNLSIHGAKYGVISTPGEGSTFWFSLRIENAGPGVDNTSIFKE